MKTIFQGKIEDFVPFVKASIVDGVLIIDKNGNFTMTVDSGFSSGIALPHKLIKQIGLKPIVYDKFELATGEIVELPVYLGKVIVKNKIIETGFIPGESLIGMEFLYSAGSILTFGFKKNTVKLTK
jgi:predicted aspartyl protease